MSWQNEPDVMVRAEVARARGRLWRSALFWGPLFLVTGSLLVFFFFDRLLTGGDSGGTWFLVVLLAILSFLFGFQAGQATLDLSGGIEEATGEVTRRWSRSDSLVVRSHYIRLDNKRILRVGANIHSNIREGDRLKVTFFPHSAVAVWAERLPSPESQGEGEGDS
ncbi:MAG: hypothetical protein DYG91_12605 [Chloroflexi bacterium CFX7]|nr:MAG: hypothetical protein EDM76_01170 [bacterium]MCE7929317.1 hypothetical protein [Chloroflexi bacterium CFX7]MCK6564797.1 hypothetical protein [Dehalococcoidia bacterium]MCL4230536.1 hypothetical protein [Dehalococcoidia bacterium]